MSEGVFLIIDMPFGPEDRIILAGGEGCHLFGLFSSPLNPLSQSMMFRPLGIMVFSLWVHTNFLLSLGELDLGVSFSGLMYSWIYTVI